MSKAKAVVHIVCEEAEMARDRWLKWLEASLLMRGWNEGHLANIVQEALSPEDAVKANKLGLAAQLMALLAWQENLAGSSFDPRYELVRYLEDALDERLSSAIPAQVRVRSGPALERLMSVDCLEWFANHTVEEVDKLLLEGLSNSEASNQVVLWLARSSLSHALREELRGLLGSPDTVYDANDSRMLSAAGLAVNIDAGEVLTYVTLVLGESGGGPLSHEAFSKLAEAPAR